MWMRDRKRREVNILFSHPRLHKNHWVETPFDHCNELWEINVKRIENGEGGFWFQKRLVQRLEQKREEGFWIGWSNWLLYITLNNYEFCHLILYVNIQCAIWWYYVNISSMSYLHGLLEWRQKLLWKKVENWKMKLLMYKHLVESFAERNDKDKW